MSQQPEITEATPGPPPETAPPQPKEQPEPAPYSAGWPASVQSLVSTVVIAVFVITFIVQAFQIPSESMENTLLIGDYLLVDKVHYGQGGIWGHVLPYSTISHGDIVVFRYPVHPSQHFVKRVIGIPGDRVRLVNRQVYVNGIPVAEKYAVFRSPVHDYYRDDFPAPNYLSANVEAKWWLQMRGLIHGGELTVPPGQYFVLGDNRDESLDSRYWGFVPQANIIGRPLIIYWSIRSYEDGEPRAVARSSKLVRFAYVLTHIFQQTRWQRTFLLVK